MTDPYDRLEELRDRALVLGPEMPYEEAADLMEAIEQIEAGLTPEEYRARMTSPMAFLLGLSLPEVAPDVYAEVRVEDDGSLRIPTVSCGDPGKGKVAAWIDTLADKHVIFVCVINRKLRDMLVRRGYTFDESTANCERRP